MKKTYLFRLFLMAVTLVFGSAFASAQYSGAGVFQKITSVEDITDGYYVVLDKTDAFVMSNNHSGVFLTRVELTPDNGTINNPTVDLVWKIETNDGAKTIYNEAIKKYVSYTGSSNNVQIVDEVTTDNQRWVVTYTDDSFVFSNKAIPARMLQYNSGSPRFACYTSAQQKLSLYKLVEAGENAVLNPTFTPPAGTYLNTQSVEIASGTEGAQIFYTVDGSEPSESSAVYSTPVVVSGTTTLKARAYKAGMDPSAVVTAVYTFPEDVADIATLRGKAAGSTPYRLTGEAVLTMKASTRNTKFIQDATAAIVIDDFAGNLTTNYNVGDGITGIVGTITLYNGLVQFVPIVDAGAASSTGNTVEPLVVTLENMGNYQSRLVKLEGVTIDGAGNFAAGTNYNLNGANNPVLRTHFADLDYIGAAIPATPQDIVGVPIHFNTTVQFVPRSLADFENAGGAPVPYVLVNPAEVSGLFYDNVAGGPSLADKFEVSGNNLIDFVTVTAPENFEVSLESGANFAASLKLTPDDVELELTGVYVRLVAGLNVGNYSGTVKVTSNDAAEKEVQVSGSVIEPVAMPAIIISEVYGGGGNSNATYTHDYFELYNPGSSEVDMSGWSLQYVAAASGGKAGSSNVFEIPEGTVLPSGKHLLISGASGTNGEALPVTPDLKSSINAAAGSGKVFLYSVAEAQTIDKDDINSILGNENLVDYLPFGTTAIPVWGSAMSSNGTNTTSISRKKDVEGNYIYTGNIGNDFEVTASLTPENYGELTSVSKDKAISHLYARDGKVFVDATAGAQIEVYNVAGQKLAGRLAADGINTISINTQGVLIVKVGDRVGKVILK